MTLLSRRRSRTIEPSRSSPMRVTRVVGTSRRGRPTAALRQAPPTASSSSPPSAGNTMSTRDSPATTKDDDDVGVAIRRSVPEVHGGVGLELLQAVLGADRADRAAA